MKRFGGSFVDIGKLSDEESGAGHARRRRGGGLLSGFYQIADGDERGEPELSYFGRRPSAEVDTLPGLLDTRSR